MRSILKPKWGRVPQRKASLRLKLRNRKIRKRSQLRIKKPLQELRKRVKQTNQEMKIMRVTLKVNLKTTLKKMKDLSSIWVRMRKVVVLMTYLILAKKTLLKAMMKIMMTWYRCLLIRKKEKREEVDLKPLIKGNQLQDKEQHQRNNLLKTHKLPIWIVSKYNQELMNRTMK